MRDPFRYLGRWSCHHCGHEATATDASWLDRTHVLARVETTCEHGRVVFCLVDLDDPAWRNRCKAGTRAGTRCKRTAVADGLCSLHAGKVTR